MDLQDRVALITGASGGLGAVTARMFARVPPARIAAVKEQAVLKRTTNPEDVAWQVVAFCQSNSVTGQTLVIDSGVVFH